MPSISLFDIQFGINIAPWENEELVKCLTRVTKLGYNGVEVTGRTYREYADRIEILKEITDDVGIDITSYVLPLNFHDLARDSTLLDHFQRLASFIQKVGGSYIIIEQGLKPEWKPNEEDQLQDLERYITDFAGICSDSDVELIFHPTPQSFIRTPDMLERVVELIYPLGSRICFDICSLLQMGVHPIQFMKKYFDAIKVVHFNDMKIIKDKKGTSYQLPEKMLLGKGRVDLESIWLYLQAMEYKGWVIAEVPEHADLQQGIDTTTDYFSKSLEVFLTNLL